MTSQIIKFMELANELLELADWLDKNCIDKEMLAKLYQDFLALFMKW